MVNSYSPGWEIAVHLAVAGNVFDGVFLCCPFFPRDVLDEIWDIIESVSEGFSTYFCQRGECLAMEFSYDHRQAINI